MNSAVGLIEVFGLTTAFVAADAACKAANVEIEAFDKNKPGNADKLKVPLLILIKIRGSIADVRVAVEAAELAANRLSGVNSKSIMSRPDSGIKKFLNESCIR